MTHFTGDPGFCKCKVTVVAIGISIRVVTSPVAVVWRPVCESVMRGLVSEATPS